MNFRTVAAMAAALSLVAQPSNKKPGKAAEKSAAVRSNDKASAAVPAPGGRGDAYYNYSMGRIYADLAEQWNRRAEYVNQAIDYFRAALKADPSASHITEDLADLYVQGGKIRDAVVEQEELLKKDPNNLNARRILGRIFSRMIGDQSTGRVNEEMLRKALEQYDRLAAAEPKNTDVQLMRGRLLQAQQNTAESEKAYKFVLEQDPNSEEALSGLALLYSSRGDHEMAAAMLRRVVEKNPNPRALLTLADAYERQKDYKNAAEILGRALDVTGPNPDINRAYAQNLLFSDQYEKAREVFNAIVAEEPKDAMSWFRLSQINQALRDLPKARAAVEKAIELEPNNTDIQFQQVNLLQVEGKSEEAIGILRKLVLASARMTYTPQEKNARIMLLERLGVLYRDAERYSDAITQFDQARQLDNGESGRLTAQIVETHRAARDYRRALTDTEDGLRRHKDDRTLKFIQASLLAETGKAADGAVVLRSMLGGKDDQRVYVSLAQLWEKGKNYDEMNKALEAADKLSQDPDDKETLHFLRGAMYEKQKKFPEAEAEFRKVLARAPDNASALNYLGYMLADRNVRLDEAYKMISRALEMDPANGAYLDSLGWVYFRMNRLPEAEQELRKAITRVTRDPTVYDHLGDVLARQGKLKDAVAQWDRSLKEWDSSAPSDIDPAELDKIRRKIEEARPRVAREGGAVR
jgi:tetratricopeptide (TPR) repeat protein